MVRASLLQYLSPLPLLLAVAKADFYVISGNEHQQIILPDGGTTTGDAAQNGVWYSNDFGCSGQSADHVYAGPQIPYCSADPESWQMTLTTCGFGGHTVNFNKDVSGDYWDVTIEDDATIVASCHAPDGCVSGDASSNTVFDSCTSPNGADGTSLTLFAQYLCHSTGFESSYGMATC